MLTKYLSTVNAGGPEDLFAARVLVQEGRDVVDLAIDGGPAVELGVVVGHILEGVVDGELVLVA
jgi:hypothetical protein